MYINMIKKLEQGPLPTNTYIIINENNNSIVIDPTGNIDNILRVLGDSNVLAILLTHGHWDHIQQVDKLKEMYKCPIFIHKDDHALASNNNCLEKYGFESIVRSDVIYYDNNTLEFDGMKFDTYHTPGHTIGSIIIRYENNLFTGDTIFKESIGRTDFPESDHKAMFESLKYIKTFDPIYDLYPGHGDNSTLEYELKYNPYLR